MLLGAKADVDAKDMVREAEPLVDIAREAKPLIEAKVLDAMRGQMYLGNLRTEPREIYHCMTMRWGCRV